MPVFAAVDIGSNSVRLSIARLEGGKLIPLHLDREVTRLGEGVFANGALDPQAMATTIKVLRRFHRAAQSYGADRVRVVATSATRDAKNAKVFADLVKSATGWRLEVISGLEEGRLIHLGVVSKTRIQVSRLLLFDLGGGSCELTISKRGHIEEMVSLPLGAVRLTQEFLHHDPPKARELERLQKFIDEEIARVTRQIIAARTELVIATSGTAAAIAGAAAEVSGKSKRALRGMVPRPAIVRLANTLTKLKRTERQALPGINAKRAEIIVAGAAVFATIFSRCGLRGFRYSPLGLRDGLLAQMAADYDAHSRSRKQIESDRWDALLAACRHYRVDMTDALQVRKLASELFQALRRVHRLPPDYREWLSAAAMLHEVGMYINRAGRHRHTHYIIAHSEIFGYSEAQRSIIACIARYQGNTHPADSHRLVKQLLPKEREHVVKAVVLLRLARALDHGHRGAVRSLKGSITDARARLHLKVGRDGAELERWAIEKEFDYFREVFGRELELAES
jgi:exopolyphosphatase/guanosine-5'-triphosphate,3'-diphosphate pyrophosphatase